jgi:hypothetical protein
MYRRWQSGSVDVSVPGAIDEEMAKIMEKHPGRKVYSKGFVKNW